ncbi:hypothetical protein D3C76_1367320 [compost metagenome]
MEGLQGGFVQLGGFQMVDQGFEAGVAVRQRFVGRSFFVACYRKVGENGLGRPTGFPDAFGEFFIINILRCQPSVFRHLGSFQRVGPLAIR